MAVFNAVENVNMPQDRLIQDIAYRAAARRDAQLAARDGHFPPSDTPGFVSALTLHRATLAVEARLRDGEF